MKYLNNAKDYKLCYNRTGKILVYSDSDFSRDIKDRKSTSGYIIHMGNNPICWISINGPIG